MAPYLVQLILKIAIAVDGLIIDGLIIDGLIIDGLIIDGLIIGLRQCPCERWVRASSSVRYSSNATTRSPYAAHSHLATNLVGAVSWAIFS
jgi:hypothetical protein